MSLKAVNLNLIPVLRELLRLRSVSGAARVLGRSPSAVSEGLAQLRQSFGDPLLVRGRGGMMLTSRAEALIGQVETLYVEMERMFAADSVDPAGIKRLFTIAAHDFHVFALGPMLIKFFGENAPGFTLRFVDLSHNLSEQLAMRDVDFALMPDLHLGELASIRLRHFDLLSDRTVVLARAGHAIAASPAVDRTQLARYEQIAFHPTWEPIEYSKAIAALRRAWPIRARIAQITLLPMFLIDTDFIALVPEGLAKRMGAMLGLVYRPLAIEDAPVRSVLAWSAIQDADPAHRWFRDRIASRLVPMLAAGAGPLRQ